jgi:hypothetical protein
LTQTMPGPPPGAAVVLAMLEEALDVRAGAAAGEAAGAAGAGVDAAAGAAEADFVVFVGAAGADASANHCWTPL